MRPIRTLFLTLGVLAFAVAATADEKDDKKALKELEGTYLIVGVEAKGMKLTEEDLKKFAKNDEDRQIVIKGDQINAKSNGKDDPATIKLDASQKPPHIDITSLKNGKTEVNYGIYKVEKDTLTICAVEKGEAKDRPKEFKAGDGVLILVLKKQTK
jgi:uncharacterized protein (TIGR03067 family)